jgi:hypothetical protein
MTPENAMLLPWFIIFMLSLPLIGFFIALREMRSKSKPRVGRHARPSVINGTASVQKSA